MSEADVIPPHVGVDCGTMFICAARDDGKGEKKYTTVRDCYRILGYDSEFEATLMAQSAHYLRSGDELYVLGNDAYLQSGMAEFGLDARNGMEVLQRPMKDGVLNPESPKVSMMILRELVRACIEKDIGPARKGEILYFSVPANPVDDVGLTNTFHVKMMEKYLCGLGYDARPLSESLAVIFSEGPAMHAPDGKVPFTGIGISFGAGMVNFCLALRGLPLDEFSVARSGDWLDNQVARMVGQSKTKVLRVKERELDFDKIPEDNEILLALDVYYDELIRYVFGKFIDRFKNSRGTIDYPIDVVLAGGTASPHGFDGKVKRILDKMKMPFEINSIRLAQDMHRAVANGCYLRARQIARRSAKTSEHST